MADDFDPANPFPPDKRKSFTAEHLAKYKRKPGDPPLNPEGNNGRKRAEYVAAILDGNAQIELQQKLIAKLGLPPGTPLIDALVHRDVVAGLGSNEPARKFLIEQYAGKARMQMEVTGSGVALRVLAVLPDNGHGPGESEAADESKTDASDAGQE